ncbi:MAG: phenylalanine--tRNA ligase subunit beta [Candidatus Methylopumilus sp.]|nr:phenylalanine--tRNA ligase subunit beta [Candidatus Methylopumilus sp.]
MQFSENWLRSYVKTSLDSDALNHVMIMAGLDVDDSHPLGATFSHVVVGEIVSIKKHPDADRLQVCDVNIGDKTLQIVCGASNARQGIKVACALVGAKLPSMDIKEAKVRGVESFGMLCSFKELGLAEEAEGILELNHGLKNGTDLRVALDLNDQITTLKLTPNRSDCLSVWGVAREVAAISTSSLSPIAYEVNPIKQSEKKNVVVQEKTACPRYCGRIIKNVDNTKTLPDWMVSRLERSNIKSISPIVDITNYVLLEIGQPLHAFDHDKLQGDVVVRFAKADEPIHLLNDTKIKLSKKDLVIADSSGVIAFAGVMGGMPSSVTETSQTIFLESAFFDPIVIAGKARAYNLSTDSSYRFERGVDFANTRLALERASSLMIEYCGGEAGEITEVLNVLPTRNEIHLRLKKLNAILGIEVPSQDVERIFHQLGFEVNKTIEGFKVTPPSYRFDIAIEEDLIEEVVRLYGYDKIPSHHPVSHQAMLPTSEACQQDLKEALTSRGFYEAVTYSFIEHDIEKSLHGNSNPIQLQNPIASQMSTMRSSLWGSHLEVLTYNLNRQLSRLNIFEIAQTFQGTKKDFIETEVISGLSYGSFMPEQWADKVRDIDFYDIKAHVEALTSKHLIFQKTDKTPLALHPGQTAEIFLDGQSIGWAGKLHPKWQQHFSLPKAPFIFELKIEKLLEDKAFKYEDISKFLPVRRDIAIVVDESVEVNSILDAVYKAKIPFLNRIALFDLYQGKGIAENKKSVAFLILMQDTSKTLVDSEADSSVSKIVELLEKQFGATLRN